MMSIERIVRAPAAMLPFLMFFSFSAQAGSGCVTDFSTTYPGSETYNLAGCQTCHVSPGGGSNFNRYGEDLRLNGANGGGFNCDANNVVFTAVLAAVEPLDSDGEGNPNKDEINAGTQPGWCDSQNAGCVNVTGTPPNVPLDPAPANGVPVADAGGPYSGEAGTTLIQFDGSASSDPDSDPLSYAWDFGDGTNGDGVMPTHTYAVAGNFTVTLVVSDGTDSSDPSVTSAEITEPPVNLTPTADPGGPYAGRPGEPVTFDGGGSSDPNGDTLTYVWDFGDGAMGEGATPTHTYAADGVYTVSLTVNDGQLDSSIAMTTAEIATPPANRPPIADAGGPYAGDTGALITFDGTSSSDPDGDMLSYLWDFGDGAIGDGVAPMHSYANAGTYTISLVVNDGKIDSPESTSVVEITDPVEQSDGQGLYNANCVGCHGDPWDGPAVDASLPGLRRVAGARSCNIYGSIFGTSVFPNGVPEMQFLQGLTEAEIAAVADYLSSGETSGERRYVATCAGCHGNDGSGGRTDEDVHGDSADETWEAIEEEEEMRYLACMPRDDIHAIAEYLRGFDDDNDDDGIRDDDDDDDDNDGIRDDEDDDDDNDGRSDDEEREDGTDPRDRDSDDDDVDDGDEHENGTDPLDSDSDDDGLSDGDERDHGTDPNDSDTDDDGDSDGREVNVLRTNPLVAGDAAGSNNSGSGGGSPSLPFLVLLAIAALSARPFRSDPQN